MRELFILAYCFFPCFSRLFPQTASLCKFNTGDTYTCAGKAARAEVYNYHAPEARRGTDNIGQYTVRRIRHQGCTMGCGWTRVSSHIMGLPHHQGLFLLWPRCAVSQGLRSEHISKITGRGYQDRNIRRIPVTVGLEFSSLGAQLCGNKLTKTRAAKPPIKIWHK